MSGRLAELALRRDRLVIRAAEQRAALAASSLALLPPGRLAARLLSVTRIVQSHPVCAVAALAMGGVIVARWRHATLWVGRAWMAWRAWQSVQLWLRRPASD